MLPHLPEGVALARLNYNPQNSFCIPKRLPGRPDEALGGGNQGPSAPAWARQHHRQRDQEQDREIGVFRHVAPTRGYVSNFLVRPASS